MRYPVKKYAQALHESVKGKPQGEAEQLLRSFLKLIESYHDRSLLPRIIEHYEKIQRKSEGVVKVEATSAKKLSAKVKSDIEKKFGAKLVLVEKVHPDVLGGVKLIVNDEYLIDGTFAGRVDKLYKALMAGANK